MEPAYISVAHPDRRGATYSWRRRIPQPLCRFFCKGEALIVSLGPRDARRARVFAFVDDGTAAQMAEQRLSRAAVAESSPTLAALIALGAHRMPPPPRRPRVQTTASIRMRP